MKCSSMYSSLYGWTDVLVGQEELRIILVMMMA